MPTSGLRSPTPAVPDRKADVFRAAAELMVTKGYGGTSINDIAKAVGMTKAGLYHHMSGKQDLLYQILNHAMDELNRIVTTPVLLIDDPEERLRLIIRLQIQGLVRHGLVFVVLFSEINHLAPDQEKEIRERIQEHHALIRTTLQELLENGRLRNLDVNIATMHIMNAITGVARWKYHDFADDERLLIHETIAYTMAALLKPAE